MKRKITLHIVFPLLTLLLSINQNLQAQVMNDECSTATVIDDPTSFCTLAGVENNYNATPSDVPVPSCAGQADNDVWYSFTAVSPQIEILVFAYYLSTMDSPVITLYNGDCTNGLTEISCAEGGVSTQYQELNASNLTTGQTYYVRISSFYPGSFQLCFRSGFLQNEVSGDCPTATVICDKDAHFVPFVAGPGTDPNECDGVDCLLGFTGEANSSWFVFTAATSGTLEFTLFPTNPDDDLDFMVYHLPNGQDDCAGRILERCMVAGSADSLSGCYGPTGLNSIATDISQPPNCAPGADNFLQYMDLVAGESYALSVNNFTSTGNGFTIDWGGTAEFEGPKVGFKSDDADNIICRGEEIVLTDTSAYTNGTLDAWQWAFGNGATPFSDTTRGPHTVQYLTTGLKTVELIVKTSTGCLVTKNLDIRVDSCCAVLASVSLAPDCLPDTTCQQAAALAENAIAPFQYTWSTGQTDSIATMLLAGNYTLTIQDAFGCTDSVAFTVELNRRVEIPNAFTPNGDQANDIFQPFLSKPDVQVLQIQVWDRWGTLVHDGTSNGWDGNIDGKPAPSDVYVYRIKVKWPDGREEIWKKDVTLLR